MNTDSDVREDLTETLGRKKFQAMLLSITVKLTRV